MLPIEIALENGIRHFSDTPDISYCYILLVHPTPVVGDVYPHLEAGWGNGATTEGLGNFNWQEHMFFPALYLYLYIYVLLCMVCMDVCIHYIFIYTYIHTYVRTYIQTDRQTDRQTYRQTDRQTDIRTYRHTDRQTSIHLYIYTSIHLYIYTSIHLYIYTSNHTTIQPYNHTCIHAYMHTCIHAHMHACMHTCIHTCIHVYMYTCIHVYIHACIHVYIYSSVYRTGNTLAALAILATWIPHTPVFQGSIPINPSFSLNPQYIFYEMMAWWVCFHHFFNGYTPLIDQGLVNVPFWEYWTSPKIVAIIDH